MSSFLPATAGGTLAAIQAAQHVRERQLKEDARIIATRVVEYQGRKHNWPDEDLTEVLAALGLL